MARPRIAVVGAGYMGANHARVVADSGAAELGLIVDSDPAAAAALAARYNCSSATSITAAKDCDAAIVATTTATHTDLALSLLDAGLPLLVEKPIAPQLDDVRAVVQASARLRLPLMCGFVERFNPVVVVTLQRLLMEQPRHIVALRHSPAAARTTASVAHDLLIHDVDLCLRMVAPEHVVSIQGVAWAPADSHAEIVDCTLQFRNGAIATMSASRLSQRKVRTISIATESLLIELDLLRSNATVYQHLRHGLSADQTYRAETAMDIPFVRTTGEPLALQLSRFLELIDGCGDADAERDSILPPHTIVAQMESR
jgi:predicted dehydrogenase